MSGQEVLSQYASFNVWANQQIVDWLLSKDQSLMDKEIKSSFPTINKTLSHIWIAEYLWMCRIENITWQNLSTKHEGQNTKQISEDLYTASIYYINKLKTLSENIIDQRINYKLLSGETGNASVMYIIHHVMNHSTYHRGQLVTMGRELGLVDPPKTDFMQHVIINKL